MKRNSKYILLTILFLAAAIAGRAQIVDTLAASYAYADKYSRQQPGIQVVDMKETGHMASPLGEGDVIKFIQMLPGVSTGAEGSSAMYVRGGDAGGNLMTLDGVPIYGKSHLLGFTTAVSPEIIESTDFYVGGFPSDEGNITASHIRMKSVDAPMDGKLKASASVSNFMVGASISAPIVKDKLSFVGSFRISPIALEYLAFKNVICSHQDIFEDLDATSLDGFGKLKWQVNSRNSIALSVFASRDRYGYGFRETQMDRMGWQNLIANLQWDNSLSKKISIKTNLSCNNNGSSQSLEKYLDGDYNRLEITGKIGEWALSSTATASISDRWSAEFGLKFRFAGFNPGASRVYQSATESSAFSPLVDNLSYTMLSTVHAQIQYSVPQKLMLRAGLRFNAYTYDLKEMSTLCHPEVSLLAKVNLMPSFGIEATADYLTQYYHTLEGIPLGWSLDLIVPSDRRNAPENVKQGYAGFFGLFGRHHFRAGAYYKLMDNLVYYKDANELFSTSLSGWRTNVETGSGTSRGLEMQYDKEGQVVTCHLAYTWSKTDRLFENLNEGKAFPAKYDRRHILNASACWKMLERPGGFRLDLNTSFTLQSGHWETMQNAKVPAYVPGKDTPIEVPVVSGINDFQMPSFIRWDASLCSTFAGKRATHELSLGIYNILNRHNPLTIYYDSTSGDWYTISLFPIMPGLHYRVSL